MPHSPAAPTTSRTRWPCAGSQRCVAVLPWTRPQGAQQPSRVWTAARLWDPSCWSAGTVGPGSRVRSCAKGRLVLKDERWGRGGVSARRGTRQSPPRARARRPACALKPRVRSDGGLLFSFARRQPRSHPRQRPCPPPPHH
eukprot:scaffold9782_cov225-Isochrysis_galbana.AAC.3